MVTDVCACPLQHMEREGTVQIVLSCLVMGSIRILLALYIWSLPSRTFRAGAVSSNIYRTSPKKRVMGD